MAKRKQISPSATIERRLKEGRGKGSKGSYNPWLHTQDVPSKGKTSRIKGWKTGRVHHLLSSLETMYFYILDWSIVVSDIKEQYPLLPISDTLEIAEELGVPHPTDPKTKEITVMTTDFLVTRNHGFIEFKDEARTLRGRLKSWISKYELAR